MATVASGVTMRIGSSALTGAARPGKQQFTRTNRLAASAILAADAQY